MDPPLKFAGRRTGGAAGRAGLEPEQAAVEAAAGSPRTRGRSFPFPGIPAAKQREKVTSSNSCYSKMELAAAKPIRARLRRLPLLCGLEPSATARSHHHKTSSLQAFFTISTMIHCSSSVTTALFLHQKSGKPPLLRQLQPSMTFRARFFITHDVVWQRKGIYYITQYIKGQIWIDGKVPFAAN